MGQYQTVLLDIDAGVAIITINRPEKMNTFNDVLRAELLEAVNYVDNHVDVKVVILTGAGRAFSAGADLTVEPASDWSVVTELEDGYKPILVAINESEKLYITAVNGGAAGAGSAFALIGDLCVMSEDAYLLQAFAALSLVPDCGASWYLSQKLGPKVALEMILSGERISAQKCLELGLVNRVVPTDELLIEAKKLARIMLDKAPLSVKFSKKLVRQTLGINLADAISLEAKYQDVCINSADAKEGVNAFFEKRKPVFQGV